MQKKLLNSFIKYQQLFGQFFWKQAVNIHKKLKFDCGSFINDGPYPLCHKICIQIVFILYKSVTQRQTPPT